LEISQKIRILEYNKQTTLQAFFMANHIKRRVHIRGNSKEAAKALKLIIGNRKTDYRTKTRSNTKKINGLQGTTISLATYNTASDRIDWGNQKEMYQQGHEFFLNYHQLYADNKNNDIGEFLDLHYSLVTNYKGGKIKASANYGNVQALAKSKIRGLKLLLEDAPAAQQKLIQSKVRGLELLLED
jgi:hypothetical protein